LPLSRIFAGNHGDSSESEVESITDSWFRKRTIGKTGSECRIANAVRTGGAREYLLTARISFAAALTGLESGICHSVTRARSRKYRGDLPSLRRSQILSA